MSKMSKAMMFASIALVSSALAIPAGTIQAKGEPSVTFQLGKKTVTDDKGTHQLKHAPYLSNGNSMVPIRSLAEGLKVPITWDQKTAKVTLSTGKTAFSVKLNDDRLWKEDGSYIRMPARVVSLDGNAFVPVRAISDALHSNIVWQPALGKIIVSKSEAAPILKIKSSFDEGTDNWIGEFADLPSEGDNTIYELEHKRELLPLPGNTKNYGYKLKGMNRSDDLFMFMYKKISGLQPNATYNVSMLFDLYTNEAGGSFGVGGSGSESVFVKAGVVNIEPKPIIVKDYYRMSIDAGNQSEGGKQMQVIGNISKPDSDKEGYQRKPFKYDTKVTTNENGEAYLVIGTDSGYEGLTTLYYDNIQADFSLAR
ncbi:copper amine oxidase N-terminal domain-containing protein [Cohnella terricola]|uniref:Copper amine oxidase N-terminal domain-containing protein n=1 Tax=Cohnella terricola TaxID=1289167 RepID=A0A559JJ16_9BACL|nr:copper amine oxidase N-terminal domain-containing protein [Cohnella terricola]TVX99852.1 copper amine oxidase N-terminal domain-containing protein [Cohnella terricola]